MKTYKYIGDGAGVPGLPHEITDEAAKALGVTEILDGAIKNGSYVEGDVQVHNHVKPSPLPSPLAPLPGGEGKMKLKKGVNNG